MPLFAGIWKENTKKHIAEECKLIADAVLEKFVMDNYRNKRVNDFEKIYYYNMNAMSGWGHVFGGTNEKELKEIYDWAECIPEGVAVLRENNYRVLSGTFARNEFNKVRAKVEKEWYADHFGGTVEEAEYREFDGELSYSGTSYITEYNGNFIVFSEFLNAKATVICRFAYAEELARIVAGTDADALPSLEEGYVSDSKVDLVLVRCADNTVARTTEGIDIKEGDTFDLSFGEDEGLKIGDDWYTGGVAETEAYKVFALVPEADFITKNVVSPVFLAIVFAVVFLLTGLYAYFYRDDIRYKRVQHDILSEGDVQFGELLFDNVRLMFYLTTVVASILVLIICLLCVVDSNRIWGDDVLEDVERYYEMDSDNTELLSLFRDEYKRVTLDKMRSMLEASPMRQSEDALTDLSTAVERKIFLIDKNGAVVACSEDEYDFTGISEPDSSLYVLSGMLEGKADNISATVLNEEKSSVGLWAIRLKDADGILVTMDNESETISEADYYANYQAPEGMTLFSVDTGTGKILSSPVLLRT